MNYETWKEQNDSPQVESLVLYAEGLLDHSGLLELHTFLKTSGETLVLVDAEHPKCADFLRDLDFIDKVVLARDDQMFAAVKELTPRKMLVGANAETIKKFGDCDADVQYYSPVTSSYVNLLPDKTEKFLKDLFSRISYLELLLEIEKFRELKVLVVGETIIDEYIFCNALNKSNKEPIIASHFQRAEKYAGGVLAVANHIADFCGKVDLLSRIGEIDSERGVIQENLKKNVTPHFLVRENSPTIKKQRIVEGDARKMYEVYYFNNKPPTKSDNEKFAAELKKHVPDADLVIVTDYGHGLLNNELISYLEESAKFLAVNTQTNAGNRGFNLISKYKRADFIAIDVPESQLECRNRDVPMEDLIYEIAEKTNCPRVTITMGANGNLSLHHGVMHSIPMLSVRTIDTTGAGDAFFSLASCAAAVGLSPELTGFIGNLAGAEACSIVGNKESISLPGMLKHIRSLQQMSGVEAE